MRRPEVEHYLETHDLAATLVIFLVLIPLLVWQFAAAARRFHDFNFRGWWSILTILPGVQLFLLFMPGTKGENHYGIPPTQTLDVTSLLFDRDNIRR